MWKFLFAYLLIYSGVHGVFYHRIRPLLPQKWWVTLTVVVLLALMVAGPIITRVLEVKGHDAMARCVAYGAYFWMGFVFLFFSGSLVLYLLDGLSWGLKAVTPLNLSFLSGKIPTLFLIMCCGGVMGYGYVEAQGIRVENLVVQTEKLPPHVPSFRIALISDVHLGIINRHRELKRIMDRVKGLNPDMLVAAGDLVDGSMHNLMDLSELIQQVKPPYGKYAVTGNHEYYAGLEHAISFMEKAGFKVLRHEVCTVADLINVGGIDDGGRARKVDDGDTLSKIQNNLFTVYLKHRPTVSNETVGFFDLQLSGHTHNGQIWPFHYVVALEFPMIKGLYELEKGSKLYVSRGTGTWGPPVRFFSPPEITLIELIRSAS